MHTCSPLPRTSTQDKLSSQTAASEKESSSTSFDSSMLAGTSHDAWVEASPGAIVLDCLSTLPAYKFPLRLPPLEEITSTIDRYFAHNKIIPLFEQASFMRLVFDWYKPHSTRSRVAWAAINIVLAMSHRTPHHCPTGADLNANGEISQYLWNAQSVLSELVVRAEDFMGLQDISLRTMTPSMQLDDDIDVDLPPADPIDGVGDMYSADGSAKLNYFRARVQLAQIQGKVYDLLFSTRARKIAAHERANRVVRLEKMLDQWRQGLPMALQADVIAKSPLRSNLDMLWMATLHCTHLVCLAKIHGVYSQDTEWLKYMSKYINMPARDHEDIPRKETPWLRQSMLPSSWMKCLSHGRACMQLFSQLPRWEYHIWLNCCAYFTGLVILLSRMFQSPSHDHIGIDKQLAAEAVLFYEQLMMLSSRETFHHLSNVVHSLYKRAVSEVERAAKVNSRANNQIAYATDSTEQIPTGDFSALNPNFPCTTLPGEADVI
ncbi:hypothetical protein Daus18300_000808 [Diaporthe australafricana]|uniref:Transcription factor domain-containing protein n=1 Tax=Diaporthe australafricana TaxID=127596 RepID=A0ABR3Y366_9PEZI